ncbi:MarR family winged helix-turn-helix transcriptional regulator [Nisaea denitrificans]|uniref:MarR family winged helix-turn-helix transcriptional regulator n=1 Tax=Nisaea denitrificans TaxID=390877 RepID=UPI000414AE9D|nr:MarR family winged helix-turn-helix transcriptional regulator [Nisaea denitrificans]
MDDQADLLDLDCFLPYRLAVIAARVSKAMSVLYAEKFGISIAEWRVIAHLAGSGRVSIRDIHARVNLDKVKVSRAVSRLEEAGLVLKASNAADNRLLDITLSDEGWSVYRQIVPLASGFEADLLSALDDTERAALERVFEKLHARLDENVEAARSLYPKV